MTSSKNVVTTTDVIVWPSPPPIPKWKIFTDNSENTSKFARFLRSLLHRSVLEPIKEFKHQSKMNQSTLKLFLATICMLSTVAHGTAVPGRAAVKVVPSYDQGKNSRSLHRGGERGGASLAAKTMPVSQIKLLK
jgi:hypothetical protein